MSVLNQAGLKWLLSGVIMIATWWYGWRVPLTNAGTGEEPAGDMPFIVAHVLACLAVGFLIPSLGKYTGPIALAPAVVWIVVHVATYDGSQGASFWPIALLLILLSMPLLSLFGMLGHRLRTSFGKGTATVMHWTIPP